MASLNPTDTWKYLFTSHILFPFSFNTGTIEYFSLITTCFKEKENRIDKTNTITAAPNNK